MSIENKIVKAIKTAVATGVLGTLLNQPPISAGAKDINVSSLGEPGKPSLFIPQIPEGPPNPEQREITLDAIELVVLPKEGKPDVKRFEGQNLLTDPRFSGVSQSIFESLKIAGKELEERKIQVDKVAAVVEAEKVEIPGAEPTVTPTPLKKDGKILISAPGLGILVSPDTGKSWFYGNEEPLKVMGITDNKDIPDGFYMFLENGELVGASQKTGERFVRGVIKDQSITWEKVIEPEAPGSIEYEAGVPREAITSIPSTIKTVENNKIILIKTDKIVSRDGEIVALDQKGEIIAIYKPELEQGNSWFALALQTDKIGIKIRFFVSTQDTTNVKKFQDFIHQTVNKKILVFKPNNLIDIAWYDPEKDKSSFGPEYYKNLSPELPRAFGGIPPKTGEDIDTAMLIELATRVTGLDRNRVLEMIREGQPIRVEFFDGREVILNKGVDIFYRANYSTDEIVWMRTKAYTNTFPPTFLIDKDGKLTVSGFSAPYSARGGGGLSLAMNAALAKYPGFTGKVADSPGGKYISRSDNVVRDILFAKDSKDRRLQPYKLSISEDGVTILR